MLQYLIIKMQPPSPHTPTDSLLSPKEAEQRQLRALALQKIDSEIENILCMNLKQQSQFTDFSQQLSEIESIYQRENNQLRQEVRSWMQKCDQLERLYLATKDELLANVALLEEYTQQKLRREKETMKLKAMVKNQQNLIDQYKKNIEEELELEKELMRSTLEQERAKLEREFSHALMQMERQYQEKIRRMVKQARVKDCHTEFQQLRKYLHSNKENTMKKSPNYAVKIASEYSTTDHEPRESTVKHHKGVFIP